MFYGHWRELFSKSKSRWVCAPSTSANEELRHKSPDRETVYPATTTRRSASDDRNDADNREESDDRNLPDDREETADRNLVGDREAFHHRNDARD